MREAFDAVDVIIAKRDRRERLAFLQNETRTMIFYEAPHKLRGTLDAIDCGSNRGRY